MTKLLPHLAGSQTIVKTLRSAPFHSFLLSSKVAADGEALFWFL